jgi:hypothetical protein
MYGSRVDGSMLYLLPVTGKRAGRRTPLKATPSHIHQSSDRRIDASPLHRPIPLSSIQTTVRVSPGNDGHCVFNAMSIPLKEDGILLKRREHRYV